MWYGVIQQCTLGLRETNNACLIHGFPFGISLWIESFYFLYCFSSPDSLQSSDISWPAPLFYFQVHSNNQLILDDGNNLTLQCNKLLGYHNNPVPTNLLPGQIMFWVLIWTTEIGRAAHASSKCWSRFIHSFIHPALHNYFDYLAFPLTCRHGENMTAFAHIAHFSPMY